MSLKFLLGISLRMLFENVRELIRSLVRDIKALILLILNERKFENYLKRGMVTADFFRKNVQSTPNKPCIIYNDLLWTFQDLENYSNQVGNLFLEKYHLQKGDCAVIFLENSPQFIGLWLGLSKIGVISAFINTNLKNQQLTHSINTAKCKIVIYGFELESSISEVKKDLDPHMQFVITGNKSTLIDDSSCLEDLLASISTYRPKPSKTILPSDVIMYVYTSGTTGLPKPAIIKHDRYIGGGFGFFKGCGLSKDDRVYVTLPLYHSNGNIIGVGTSIICGTTVVLRKKFSASNFWSDCIKYKCTVFVYVGEICRFLLNQTKSPLDNQHQIRKAIGNGLRLNIWQEFTRRFNIKCHEFYAASEGNCTMRACGFVPLLNRLIKILPMAVIKIDDQMNPIRNKRGLCIECEPGEKGLLVGIIKNTTKSAYNGYANDEAATNKKIVRDVFAKGQNAFNSGDQMMCDRFGYMYFCDRLGDTYRWRGENVSTVEVENVISAFLDSREVAVYGVQIPGEEGRAGMAAILDSGSKMLDLKQFAASIKKSLPAYSRPVFVRFIKQIEHTGTFKVKKSTLVSEGYEVGRLEKEDVYYFSPKSQAYEKLTLEIHEKIQNGQLRL